MYKGYHVSNLFQILTIRETLHCESEGGNTAGSNAAAVLENTVIGHVPRKFLQPVIQLFAKMEATFTVQLREVDTLHGSYSKQILLHLFVNDGTLD